MSRLWWIREWLKGKISTYARILWSHEISLCSVIILWTNSTMIFLPLQLPPPSGKKWSGGSPELRNEVWPKKRGMFYVYGKQHNLVIWLTRRKNPWSCAPQTVLQDHDQLIHISQYWYYYQVWHFFYMIFPKAKRKSWVFCHC